jgi:hypothetical protein
MITAVRTLKRHALNELPELNIISLSYDGKFEDFLVDTGSSIYELDIIKAAADYEHSNRVGIVKYFSAENRLNLTPPNHIDFDLILCHCEQQILPAKQVALVLHCPLIYIYHNIENLDSQLVQQNADLIVSTKDESHPNYTPLVVDKWRSLLQQARKIKQKFK